VRFFTRRTIERLIADSGLRIVDSQTVGTPFDSLLPDTASARSQRVARRIARTDQALVRAWPRMFGYQFLYRLEVS
jgi:hypothetical protein